MKQLSVILAIAAMLFSCGGNKKEDVKEAGVQSSEVITEPFNDGHNARNSLEYHGTYKGILPTASGEGMEVTLTIVDDSTYVRSSVYVTPGDKFEDKGKYVWNEAGNTITLLKAEPANQYFVAQEMLYTLDMDGNKVESELAEHYILKKVTN